MNIDLLAFSAHKALMGLPGVGGLYVSPEIEPLRHWREGGTGGSGEFTLHPEEMPLRLEAGTPNTPGIVALGAAVNFIKETGLGNIRNHELELARELWAYLKSNDRFKVYGPEDFERRTSVIAFTMAGMPPEEIAAILDASFDIAVRSGVQCSPLAHEALKTSPAGTVRVSPGYFNTTEEIKCLCDALKEISSC